MIRFDVNYKFDINVETNGYHEFFGERGWTLHWSEKYKGFILDKPLGSTLDNIIAVYNDTQEYPLGLKKWNIMNDNCPGNGEHYFTFPAVQRVSSHVMMVLVFLSSSNVTKSNTVLTTLMNLIVTIFRWMLNLTIKIFHPKTLKEPERQWTSEFMQPLISRSFVSWKLMT